MFNRILDRFWPVTPFVVNLAHELVPNPSRFTAKPLWPASSTEPIYFGEDPIVISKIETFRGNNSASLAYWPEDQKVELRTFVDPDGAPINWRERGVLVDAIQKWLDRGLGGDGWNPGLSFA